VRLERGTTLIAEIKFTLAQADAKERDVALTDVLVGAATGEVYQGLPLSELEPLELIETLGGGEIAHRLLDAALKRVREDLMARREREAADGAIDDHASGSYRGIALLTRHIAAVTRVIARSRLGRKADNDI
jgi:hypothetical protein